MFNELSSCTLRFNFSMSNILKMSTKVDENSQILFQSDDKMNLQRYREIGRAMATVMSDEIFKEVPYKAKNRDALLAGIDKFLDAVTVLPPGNRLSSNMMVVDQACTTYGPRRLLIWPAQP